MSVWTADFIVTVGCPRSTAFRARLCSKQSAQDQGNYEKIKETWFDYRSTNKYINIQ